MESALRTGVTLIYQALFHNVGTIPLLNDELNSKVGGYAGVGLGGGVISPPPKKNDMWLSNNWYSGVEVKYNISIQTLIFFNHSSL